MRMLGQSKHGEFHMQFQDETLSCRGCSKPFIFSIGEQEFYANKALANKPTRCYDCRLARKLSREGKSTDYSSQHPCHECGIVTRLPFKPIGSKPVFCQGCLQKQKKSK